MKALHSYEHEEHLNYKPLYKYEMSGNTYSSQSQSSGMLSEDGQTYFCVDQLGNAYVLNVEDGSCIWKIAPVNGRQKRRMVSEDSSCKRRGSSIDYKERHFLY